MSDDASIQHELVDSKWDINKARCYFSYIVTNQNLESKKKNPSGCSQISDVKIVNSLNVIVSLCSTTAWSMRCHRITPEKIKGRKLKVEDENDEIVFLPALHQKVSKAEMFEKLIELYPKNHLEQSKFYRVAKRVT